MYRIDIVTQELDIPLCMYRIDIVTQQGLAVLMSPVLLCSQLRLTCFVSGYHSLGWVDA